jgi:hypothetical protein
MKELINIEIKNVQGAGQLSIEDRILLSGGCVYDNS